MTTWPVFHLFHRPRIGAIMLAGMAASGWVAAQQKTVQTVQTTQQMQQALQAQQAQQVQQAASVNTRFIEACSAAASSGQPMPPGCQHAMQLRGNELEQLKQEALRTRNPQLMTMVGDSYQNRRTGAGDISQAYRWYVLGAVRGDPLAMLRLSNMYHRGQGTAPDRVKAMGYAKLAQHMAPDSAAGKQAEQAMRALSKGMASKELAQADRFAAEMVQQMGSSPGSMAGAQGAWASAGHMPVAPAGQTLGGQRLPGETNTVIVTAPQTLAGAAGKAAVPEAQGQAPGKKAAAQGQKVQEQTPPLPPAGAHQPAHAVILPGQMAGQQASALQAAPGGKMAQAQPAGQVAAQPVANQAIELRPAAGAASAAMPDAAASAPASDGAHKPAR